MVVSKYLGAAPAEVAYAVSGSVETNSTGAAKDKLDKTAPPLVAGDYKISFYVEGKTDTPGTAFCKLEVLLDGVVKAETNIDVDAWQHFSGAAIFAFNDNDTPRVQLQYSRIGGGSTASVQRAYLSIEPMVKVTP